MPLAAPLHETQVLPKFSYNYESDLVLNTAVKSISWIFIPLSSNAVSTIRAWLHRLAPNKNDDADLARRCEEIIEQAFLTYKLTYNCDEYGEVRMSELRTLIYSDGICVPEHCFLDPAVALERVQEPLRPFVQDVYQDKMGGLSDQKHR